MGPRTPTVKAVLHHLGRVLQVLGGLTLVPALAVLLFWGAHGDGWGTLGSFLCASALATSTGTLLQRLFPRSDTDVSGAMILCAVSWLGASAVGAVPFVLGIGASALDAYFEAMSGFTTTGITVFNGLQEMPRSILLWRAQTQWLGGLGILSFFLMVTFRGAGAHHLFGAETHKIMSRRPVPGVANTVRILWSIYAGITVAGIVLLWLLRMPLFEAVYHTLTAVSTGGFSPYDASIGHYAASGHGLYRSIEYACILLMLLGGTSFLVHYRLLQGDWRALGDHVEVRWWWGLLGTCTLLILLDRLVQTYPGWLSTGGMVDCLLSLEESVRRTAFQVVAILTGTGFATQDIGSPWFPALSKQLFLVMMVIGGCVGSTGGGFKVTRVVMLKRLVTREVCKVCLSKSASNDVVMDRKRVPADEVFRAAAMLFLWLCLLILGGGRHQTGGGYAAGDHLFMTAGMLRPTSRKPILQEVRSTWRRRCPQPWRAHTACAASAHCQAAPGGRFNNMRSP